MGESSSLSFSPSWRGIASENGQGRLKSATSNKSSRRRQLSIEWPTAAHPSSLPSSFLHESPSTLIPHSTCPPPNPPRRSTTTLFLTLSDLLPLLRTSINLTPLVPPPATARIWHTIPYPPRPPTIRTNPRPPGLVRTVSRTQRSLPIASRHGQHRRRRRYYLRGHIAERRMIESRFRSL